jgi:hypothetical protein
MKYVGVRKVSWDQLWHALLPDTSRWDRVTEAEARKIVRKLFPRKPRKPRSVFYPNSAVMAHD